MDALVKEIFTAANVAEEENSEKKDAMTRLEEWLDMEDSSGASSAAITTWTPMDSLATCDTPRLLMEDCAPFSWRFYQSVGRVVVEAWNPAAGITDDGDGKAFVNRSIFSPPSPSDAENAPQDVSLFQIKSVRVTRWLRYWMDLNVMGASSSDTALTTFSQLLLRHCEGNTSTTASSSDDVNEKEKNTMNIGNGGEQRKVPRVHVLKALFHHIAMLPQMQHQIHVYTQSLLKSNSSSPNGSSSKLSNTRLEQLQAANKMTDKLTAEFDLHRQHLEDILGEWYSVCNSTLRASCKAHLGRIWQEFIYVTSHRSGGVGMGRMENTSACGIDLTLRVLNRILLGGTESSSLNSSTEHLLFDVLIPLHKPSGMILWRDQTPLLDLYHKPLVQCIGTILQRNTLLIPRVVSQMLQPDIWPSSQGVGSASANTPKVVLLLHEIDTFLSLLSVEKDKAVIDAFGETVGPLTVRLASCISSDNSRMSEQALQFFKNDVFAFVIKHHLFETLPTLLRALCRTSDQMQLPWNPTVRKMTRLVLQELEGYDEDAFAKACHSLFSSDLPNRAPPNEDKKEASIKPAAREGTATTMNEKQDNVAPVKDFSLRAGMGSWKPPSQTRRSHPMNKMLPPPARSPRSGGKQQPPLTVTGVAPWAVSSQPPGRDSSGNPPLTVTGVAPWASHPPPSGSMRPPRKRAVAANGLPHRPGRPLTEQNSQSATPTLDDSVPTPIIEEEEEEVDNKENAGLAKVHWYMDKLKPDSSSDQDEEGTSSWALAQMSESPTLLPTLKFHDLVFGQDLGSGAFGIVRYARQIIKSKTRSHWPEYAVKIVSTQRIDEMGYEQSINREIATLRQMSHPGIARLISSFRFRDGAYLVLEYASGGDLHTLLKNSGSLDQDSTKFVVGSIVAALGSIHDMGFVYGDLKPENVLITETNHIKLTDFGGCRPVTYHAKELIRFSGKNALKELRDGDWKPQNKPKDGKPSSTWSAGNDKDTNNMDLEEGEDEEDHRIEGTTAYLPPEVVIGARPTLAADSWALGCVMYQCLSGRPPLLEDDDEMTRNKIVAFHLSQQEHHTRDALFEDDQTTFTPEARALVLGLLHREPASRPNMPQVAEDPFFEGVDVLSLHKHPGHPLDVGSVAPVADAKWSRRQFSSIWAPQPEAYIISAPSSDKTMGPSQNGPIPEGEEANAFFSKSHQHSSFGNIPENVPVS